MATMDERGEFDRKSSYLHAIVSRRAKTDSCADHDDATLLLTIAAAAAASCCMGIIKRF